MNLVESPTDQSNMENFSAITQSADAEMVDIHVGKDPKSGRFKIHKAPLCQTVPYFERMFNGYFLEVTTSSATLPEDDPEVFNIFVSWIYEGKLPPFRGKDNNGPFNWPIWKFYVLADKLCLPQLMSWVMLLATQDMWENEWLPNFQQDQHNLHIMLDIAPRKSCAMFRMIANFVCGRLFADRRDDLKDTWPMKEIQLLFSSNDDLQTEINEIIIAREGLKIKDPWEIVRSVRNLEIGEIGFWSQEQQRRMRVISNGTRENSND